MKIIGTNLTPPLKYIASFSKPLFFFPPVIGDLLDDLGVAVKNCGKRVVQQKVGRVGLLLFPPGQPFSISIVGDAENPLAILFFLQGLPGWGVRYSTRLTVFIHFIRILYFHKMFSAGRVEMWILASPPLRLFNQVRNYIYSILK